MTTMVETAEDFIRILRERPDIREQVRRELLTDELLELPQKFAELVEQVKVLQEQVKTLQDQVKVLQEQVKTLQDQVKVLQEQMKTLQDQVKVLQEQMKNFQEVQSEHTVILNDHTQRLGRLENRMDQLVGNDLERKARKIMQGRLSRCFGLRRMRVSHDQFAVNGPFLPAIEAAADDGKIDDEQEERLKLTDLIIRARAKPDSPLRTDVNQYIWFPIEVSGIIERNDIDRAVRSAAALRAMYGENALPAVAGFRIRDEDRARAEEEGVSVFIIPDM